VTKVLKVLKVLKVINSELGISDTWDI